jgi:5-methylcytosine-specific restriction endonuclease McrA
LRKRDFDRMYSEYLISDQWKDKRHLVLLRDNNVCKSCFSAPATLVHHKTYIHVFDEPLFDLESVCKECHDKIHGKMTDIERFNKFKLGINKPLEIEEEYDEEETRLALEGIREAIRRYNP